MVLHIHSMMHPCVDANIVIHWRTTLVDSLRISYQNSRRNPSLEDVLRTVPLPSHIALFRVVESICWGTKYSTELRSEHVAYKLNKLRSANSKSAKHCLQMSM